MANPINAADLESFEGTFKTVWGDRLVDLIPEAGKLMRVLNFKPLKKLGEEFHIPVILSTEQGITYAGADEDAFLLEDAEAMSTKPAKVRGAQIVGKTLIGFKTAASAPANDARAFASATESVVKSIMDSTVRAVEQTLLYGDSDIGLADAFTNVSATETILDLTQKSFAAGIWVGARGMRLEVFDPADVQVGTTFEVKKVDVRQRKLTVTGLAGDITALEAAITALLAGEAVALYRKGAKGKQSLGLDAIIKTDGLLFGIDNSEYDLFKGHIYDAGDADLTFDKITDAVIDATHYGLDGDLICLCSPEAWQSLNKDEAALREYDASFKAEKAEKGVEGIEYHYQMGKIKVISHPMVKQGEAFILNPDQLSRVGAYDVSFKSPVTGEKMVRMHESRTAYEMRTYTDQALFTDKPAHLVKIENIVVP